MGFDSMLWLSPQSIPGVFRYRFFEAMTASRIPVHVGDGHVLPWEKQIPWNDIAVFVPSGDVSRTGEICAAWMSGKSRQELLERGRLARHYYERYLHRDRWPELFAEALQDRVPRR